MTRPWEHQPWVEPYQRAINEANTATLPERIQTAESAIEARIAELTKSREVLELDALHDALQVLCLLQELRSIPKT
jgi:hypothetical protein